MGERVLLDTGTGAPAPLAHEVVEGTWWPDNWMSPTLRLRLPDLRPAAATLVVSGHAPGFAPRQIGNGIAVEAGGGGGGGARVVRDLPWGGRFEVSLPLDAAALAEGGLALLLRVEKGLPADGLDGRERGVVLTRLLLRPAAP